MALSTNLLAYWKLDESSGNAVDASGGGKTLNNNNSVGYAAGLINNAADFGSTDQHNKYLGTSSPPSIPTSSAFSISLWIKIRTEMAINQERYILTYSTEYTSRTNITYYGDGTNRNIRVMTEGGDNRYIHTLSTSNYTHIVITYPSSGSGKLYVNGSNVATLGRAGSLIGADGFSLGGGNYGAGIAAYIDEVGAWSRELSAAEVASLYNGGLGLAYPFPSVSLGNFFQLF